jgi:hypothetical protein
MATSAASETTLYQFDDRNIRWYKLGDFEHFVVAMLDVDEKKKLREVEVLEGTWTATRTVVVEFPSMDHAKRWYESPKYKSIVQHRFKAATSNIVLAEGFNG